MVCAHNVEDTKMLIVLTYLGLLVPSKVTSNLFLLIVLNCVNAFFFIFDILAPRKTTQTAHGNGQPLQQRVNDIRRLEKSQQVEHFFRTICSHQ